jgi:hypothetical protein
MYAYFCHTLLIFISNADIVFYDFYIFKKCSILNLFLGVLYELH